MLHYEKMEPGLFLRRCNRFTAEVEINGHPVLCHVKNTGRCRELLQPGVRVWCQHNQSPNRKTAYTLITVEKGRMLVNLDSTAPNTIAQQWLQDGALQASDIRREVQFGQSRLDVSFVSGGKQCLMEVKGVTLERNGEAIFPDAPTERGARHVQELIHAAQAGYGAYLLFVAAMQEVSCVRPNWQTDPTFSGLLEQAQQAGVTLLGLRCTVTSDSLEALDLIPVYVQPPVRESV